MALLDGSNAEEMVSVWAMGTFKVVDLPEDANLVGCKWLSETEAADQRHG